MGLSLSNAANVLKVRYIGTVREQLNNEILLFKQLNKQIQMVSGKDFTVPLHTSRNTAAAIGLGDGDDLPVAGQQGYTTTLVPNKYLYSRIMITGPTIAATRDNAGAFVEAIQSEVDGVTRDMKRAINRMLHGDGLDAVAYWNSAVATTPQPIDDGQGNNFVHILGVDNLDLIQYSALLATSSSAIPFRPRVAFRSPSRGSPMAPTRPPGPRAPSPPLPTGMCWSRLARQATP